MEPVYLLYSTVFFIVAIVVVLQVVFVVLSRKNQGRASINKIRTELMEWISMVALDETEGSEKKFELPAEIEALLKQKLGRKVLLVELLKLKKDFSGSAADNLRILYQQLNLHSDSLRKLNSRKWHRVTKGIQELAIMEQFDRTDAILRLTNHGNPHIRMEAQAAMVHMLGYKGLAFLGMIDYPITEWNQLSLLHLLENKPFEECDQIPNWLQSKNASVVKLTIRLISQQNLLQFEEHLQEKLTDENELVQVIALSALRDIGVSVNPETLLHLYKNGTGHIKLSVIEHTKAAGYEELLNSLVESVNDTDADESKIVLREKLAQHDPRVNSKMRHINLIPKPACI
jgi:hypothetical protein